ncbi:hypothetical protein GGI07_003950, partial [Coemansia sp. Benny D115]
GREAVLKLAWTPVDRMPEGAVYDVLRHNGVQGVPEIYTRGLLVKNLEGYRLEIIVMEYCGESVASFFEDSDVLLSLHGKVALVVRQVTSCLAQARSAGVLHRDISQGNIAVEDNPETDSYVAKVIDWGHAKVIGSECSIYQRVAKHWQFNYGVVGRKEKAKDPLTGTPLYMSISILNGAKRRGIMDDIESLFYVVLRALRPSKERAADKIATDRVNAGFTNIPNDELPPAGFQFEKTQRNLSLVRICCLSSEEHWPSQFGVTSDDSGVLRLLQSMRSFLFEEDGVFIGNRLYFDASYNRKFNHQAAAEFMDEDTIAKLQEKLQNANEQSKISPLKKHDNKRMRRE